MWKHGKIIIVEITIDFHTLKCYSGKSDAEMPLYHNSTFHFALIMDRAEMQEYCHRELCGKAKKIYINSRKDIDTNDCYYETRRICRQY